MKYSKLLMASSLAALLSAHTLYASHQAPSGLEACADRLMPDATESHLSRIGECLEKVGHDDLAEFEGLVRSLYNPKMNLVDVVEAAVLVGSDDRAAYKAQVSRFMQDDMSKYQMTNLLHDLAIVPPKYRVALEHHLKVRTSGQDAKSMFALCSKLATITNLATNFSDPEGPYIPGNFV